MNTVSYRQYNLSSIKQMKKNHQVKKSTKQNQSLNIFENECSNKGEPTQSYLHDEESSTV